MLGLSALDAVLGAMAAAFFGGLLAAGAYLLKEVLETEDRMRAIERRLEALKVLEKAATFYADDALDQDPPRRV